MQFPTRKPSQSRANAHRAMARAALFSNSSTAVRLRRYNSHIQKAREIEDQLWHQRRRKLATAYDTLRAEQAKECAQ